MYGARISIVCRCEVRAVSFRRLTTARFNSVRSLSLSPSLALSLNAARKLAACTRTRGCETARASNRSAIWGKRIDRPMHHLPRQALNLRLNYRLHACACSRPCTASRVWPPPRVNDRAFRLRKRFVRPDLFYRFP